MIVKINQDIRNIMEAWASLEAQMVKNPPANAGDKGSIPGSGRFPGEGNGIPGKFPFQGNPMNRGAWGAIVHGVTRVRQDLVTKQQ